MTNNSWYIYIVICKDNSLYTGITTDIDKRIATHNSGKGAKYTRGRGPVKLVYSEKHLGKSEASKREAQIKRLSRTEKLELIK
jgi:putative endonuclease